MVFERWPTLAIMKRPTKTSCKASLLASPQRGWCAGEGIVRLRRRPALEEAFCPSVPLLGDQRRCFARLAPLRCPCCCLCNGEAGGWSNPPPPPTHTLWEDQPRHLAMGPAFQHIPSGLPHGGRDLAACKLFSSLKCPSCQKGCTLLF